MCYFHYCSIETMIKILETYSIRLSSGFKMNDSRECKWLLDIYRERFNEKLLDFDDEIKQYINYALGDLDNVGGSMFSCSEVPFLACFSEEADLLSQWRGYGDDGYGFAIGFDLDLVVKNASDNLTLVKVDYDKDNHIKKIDDFLNRIGVNPSNPIKYHRVKHMATDNYIYFSELVWESASSKNPSFLEEKEHRLIFDNSVREKNLENLHNIKISKIKYRSGKSTIIPFVDLNFSALKDKRLIKEIVIGPKCNVTKDEIKDFFINYGYSIPEIKKSTSTYC